jgi:hypothetical protein
MNADKASVFIGLYRRSSAAIHVLAFFGSLARLRTISLHLLRIRRRVWQFLRLHYYAQEIPYRRAFAAPVVSAAHAAGQSGHAARL